MKQGRYQFDLDPHSCPAPVIPYSRWVQQPMRAMAILNKQPHARQAAPLDREQGRAASLHPDGFTGAVPHTPLRAADSEPDRRA